MEKANEDWLGLELLQVYTITGLFLSVFAKIEEEAKTYLKGDDLKNALDLLAYLKESGRT